MASKQPTTIIDDPPTSDAHTVLEAREKERQTERERKIATETDRRREEIGRQRERPEMLTRRHRQG